MLTMANTATFHFFYILVSSFLCSLQAGITWTSNMPLLPPGWPILMRTDCPCLLYTHTTHNNLITASIDSKTFPHEHICFKPLLLASITMPNLFTVEVPSLLEKSGCVSAPGVAKAASTASLTTSGDAEVEDDLPCWSGSKVFQSTLLLVLTLLAMGSVFLPGPRSRRNKRPTRTPKPKQQRRRDLLPLPAGLRLRLRDRRSSSLQRK
jgi:hypothetical protein